MRRNVHLQHVDRDLRHLVHALPYARQRDGDVRRNEL